MDRTNAGGSLTWPTSEEQAVARMLVDGSESSLVSLRAWVEGAAASSFEKNTLAVNMLLPGIYVALRGTIDIPRLARLYQHQWMRNQRTIEAGLGAAQLLRDGGVPAMLVHGVPLSLLYYREIGARVMADAEIVVAEADVPRADAILSSAHWTRRPAPREYQLPRLANLSLHTSPFVSTHFADSTTDLAARFWARSVEHVAGERRAQVPDATCMLLLACLRGIGGELHSRVQWILDAAAILQKVGEAIDWSVLLETAPVREALSYLEGEIGLPIPRQMLEKPMAPARPVPNEPASGTVCLVAILKNEEPFLEEWIAYHRLIGIDQFVLYDNDPALPLAPLLAHHAPYVTVVPWVGKWEDSKRRLPQVDAYLDALDRLPSTCQWVTFLDGDEFLVLRQHTSITDFLASFEGTGQIMLQWLVFGHNGYFDNPKGLITSSLRRRRATPGLRTKFIVRREAIADLDSPHVCKLHPGFATSDASGQPFSAVLDADSTRFAHVNHYQCRSFRNWMARVERGDVNFRPERTTPDNHWRLDEEACLRAFVAFTRENNELVDDHMLRYEAAIQAYMARVKPAAG